MVDEQKIEIATSLLNSLRILVNSLFSFLELMHSRHVNCVQTFATPVENHQK